jgi:hypothetical protein
MKVIVTEHGQRPHTLTKARAIAPQASKYLADKLDTEEFADSAVIVLDWDGGLFWQGEGSAPEDFKTPLMAVICEKRYPQLGNRLLTVDYKLELEDFFGADNATKDDLDQVVENLRTKVREEETRKGI